MQIKEIVQGLLDIDSYDCLMWLQWLSQKKISCQDCVNTMVLSNKVPDCNKCLPKTKTFKKISEKGAK